jgi:hypothetical protein
MGHITFGVCPSFPFSFLNRFETHVYIYIYQDTPPLTPPSRALDSRRMTHTQGAGGNSPAGERVDERIRCHGGGQPARYEAATTSIVVAFGIQI